MHRPDVVNNSKPLPRSRLFERAGGVRPSERTLVGGGPFVPPDGLLVGWRHTSCMHTPIPTCARRPHQIDLCLLCLCCSICTSVRWRRLVSTQNGSACKAIGARRWSRRPPPLLASSPTSRRSRATFSKFSRRMAARTLRRRRPPANAPQCYRCGKHHHHSAGGGRAFLGTGLLNMNMIVLLYVSEALACARRR